MKIIISVTNWKYKGEEDNDTTDISVDNLDVTVEDLTEKASMNTLRDAAEKVIKTTLNRLQGINY